MIFITSNKHLEGVAVQKNQDWQSDTKWEEKFEAKVQEMVKTNSNQSMTDLSRGIEVCEKNFSKCGIKGI